MNIVFMGTPEFAVPSLRSLVECGYHISGVVTQPDRPKGRKRELTPPPVKVAALELGLPVYQPESLKAEGAVDPIFAWQPDLIVTAAYGQILPVPLLQFPRYRCINVHASLLPKYRGGAPIQHAIMNGDLTTGVTVMYMEKGLDTGDMLAVVEVPISDDDDNGTMHERLSRAGATLLLEMLPRFLRGEISPLAQEESDVSYARNILRSDERIEWQRTSRQIFNQIRGLHPWPIAFTIVDNEIVKVWKATLDVHFAEEDAMRKPGTILRYTDQQMVIRTGDGAIGLTVIQVAGKKAMSVAEYVHGKHLLVGTVFQS